MPDFLRHKLSFPFLETVFVLYKIEANLEIGQRTKIKGVIVFTLTIFL